MAKTEQERLIELRNQSANNQFDALLKQNRKDFVYFAKEHMFFGKKLKKLHLISTGASQEAIAEIDEELDYLKDELTKYSIYYSRRLTK